VCCHRRSSAGTTATRERRSCCASTRTAEPSTTRVRLGVGDVAVGPRPPEWHGPVVELGWEEFVAVLPAFRPAGAEQAAGRASSSSPERELGSVRARPRPVRADPRDLRPRRLRAPAGRSKTGQVAAAGHLAAAGLGVTIIPQQHRPDGTGRGNPPPQATARAPSSSRFTRQDWSPLRRRVPWRCSRSRPGTAGRPPRPSSSSTGQAAAHSGFAASCTLRGQISDLGQGPHRRRPIPRR